MLKLIVPSTLLNAIATSISSIAFNANELEHSHPALKADLQETEIKNAEIFKITVEEYREKRLKDKEENIKKFLSRLPVMSNIKEVTKKFGYIQKNEDSLEIAINDEYLIECVDIATRTAIKMLKPMADVYSILKDSEETSKAIEKKWFPKDDVEVEEEIKVETTKVEATDVPSDIRSSIEYHGWKLDPSNFVKPEPLFTDENHEEFIEIHFFHAINEKKSVETNVATPNVEKVLKSTKTLLETAKDANLPVSLVKAIRDYYGFERLEDKAPE